jgi:WD40 repeat protein
MSEKSEVGGQKSEAGGEKSATKADPAATHLDKEWKYTRPLIACRYDPANRFVFAGTEDNSIQRWNLADGKAAGFTGHESWVRALAFDPKSTMLYSGGYEGRILFWPAAADQPAPARSIEAHQGWVRSLAVSPDGKLLASGGNDNKVRLWNTADGKLVREVGSHADHVYQVMFHPAGQYLVSCDLKGVIRQWDVAGGTQVRELSAATLHKFDNTFRAVLGGSRGMAFSPDGKLLAVSGITNVTNAFAGIGNPVVISFEWESGKQKQQHVLKEPFNGVAWGVRFHPDGYWLAICGGQTGGHLLAWQPDQQHEFVKFKLPNMARDFDLHGDGIHFAVAHADGALRTYAMRKKA